MMVHLRLTKSSHAFQEVSDGGPTKLFGPGGALSLIVYRIASVAGASSPQVSLMYISLSPRKRTVRDGRYAIVRGSSFLAPCND